MPIACFTYKLNPGVTAEKYEAWVTGFDYQRVAQIKSVKSQRIYRVNGTVFGAGPAAYDYLEIIEFDDRDHYIRDLETHPAAQEIKEQVFNFVSIVNNTHLTLVPPGVNHP
jgi:hypothetical protein